jgi:IS30 family transposase
MSRHYNHLSTEERDVVQIEIQDGKSMRSIARRLGRSPSTLGREVARQGVAAYSATEAGKDYRTRRLRSVGHRRLIEGSELSQFVRDHVVLYRWSPSKLLSSFATCIRTIPASASATRRFTPASMPTRLEG